MRTMSSSTAGSQQASGKQKASSSGKQEAPQGKHPDTDCGRDNCINCLKKRFNIEEPHITRKIYDDEGKVLLNVHCPNPKCEIHVDESTARAALSEEEINEIGAA